MIRDSVLVDLAAADDEGSPVNPIRVAIPMIGTGRLHELVVTQTAGTLAGFSAQLFSAYTAAPPNIPTPGRSTIGAEPATGGEGTPDVYALVPTIIVAGAAKTGRYTSDANGLAYYNTHNTIRQRYDELYLEITVTTPDAAKTFDVRAIYEEADQ